MQLNSLLTPKLIYFETKQLPKEKIIKVMIEKICADQQYKNCAERLYNLVIERESQSPTVYPTGMAIPHVRIDGLDDTIIAICIPAKPIIDNNQEVKIYILILTDKNVSSLYLNVVAAFMRISKDTEFFNKLLTSKDAHAFIDLIKVAEVKIKEEVTISDIMTCNPLVINENQPIKALADLLSEHSITYLPVVNDNGDWVGEVNLLQYLNTGLPDYMLMMNSVNFLRSFEPFERLYRLEEEVTVKKVMTKPDKVLYPEYSIIEAIFEMVKQDRQTFSVIKDKKVVGIVTAMDIYRRVVRA